METLSSTNQFHQILLILQREPEQCSRISQSTRLELLRVISGTNIDTKLFKNIAQELKKRGCKHDADMFLGLALLLEKEKEKN